MLATVLKLIYTCKKLNEALNLSVTTDKLLLSCVRVIYKNINCDENAIWNSSFKMPNHVLNRFIQCHFCISEWMIVWISKIWIKNAQSLAAYVAYVQGWQKRYLAVGLCSEINTDIKVQVWMEASNQFLVHFM